MYFTRIYSFVYRLLITQKVKKKKIRTELLLYLVHTSFLDKIPE